MYRFVFGLLTIVMAVAFGSAETNAAGRPDHAGPPDHAPAPEDVRPDRADRGRGHGSDEDTGRPGGARGRSDEAPGHDTVTLSFVNPAGVTVELRVPARLADHLFAVFSSVFGEYGDVTVLADAGFGADAADDDQEVDAGEADEDGDDEEDAEDEDGEGDGTDGGAVETEDDGTDG